MIHFMPNDSQHDAIPDPTIARRAAAIDRAQLSILRQGLEYHIQGNVERQLQGEHTPDLDALQLALSLVCYLLGEHSFALPGE